MRHLKRSGMQRVKRQATVEALEQRTLLSAIYSTTMDTNPGWTLDTGWAYGVPAGTGGDPSSSQVHTGTKVVGTVITSPGYYPDNVPSTYYAKTAAIDCSSYTGVTLDFWRWLGVEGNDKAYVQVGSNGTWTTLWTNSGTVNESSWSHQTYDISSAADYQGTVYIRWGLGPTNASIHYCGWNIDDVTVSGNLDTTPPTVSSINRVGTTSTNASSVQFAVTLSESVTGVDTSDFALASTGTAAGSIASVSGSGSSYTLTVDSVTGDGTLGLNLADNDTVLDLAGNKLGGTGTGNGNFTGQTYTLDHTAPLVGSINRVGSTPTNASSVQFSVTLSESVTGVDTSDFALATTGTAAGTIASVSGSGSSYTVTVNSVTGDGTLGLNLVDNDSIQDSAGNKLGGTGTGNGNFTGQPFTVDHTAPLVSSINRVGTSPTNASSVQFAVTLTESVTGVDTSDFALASTGAASGSIASVSGSGSSYTVTVNSVTGDGTLGLNLVDDDSVQDSASNKLGGTGTGNGNFMGQTFTLDHTAPVVSSITRVGAALTNASSVQFSVTLSESVTGVDVSDFVLASTEAVSGSIASVSGAGSSYTVTVNSVIGDGTLGLNLVDNDSVTDAVGNALGGSGAANGSYTGEVCTIDQTPPVLLSLKAVRTPTNSPDLEWLATFSESVSNVHYSDFALLGGVPAVVATAYGYGGASIMTYTLRLLGRTETRAWP